MKYFKYFIIVIVIIFITGCNNKGDKDKFYIEYNKYNNNSKYITVELSNSNIYKYDTDIKEIFKNNSIIFIGDSNDNKSRLVANILDKVIDNTDVNKIYYYDNIDIISDYIEDKINIPVVLFVIDGKIDSYIINDKDKLSDDEEIELYNKYLEGVHKVLGDVCDEEC